ncbi:bifunctional nuclease family protein [bacterium]|nr:bifunctional nuclease family protein [bacterium]
MAEKIQLHIVGLTTGHSQKNSYTLILGEMDGDLKLPVVIGSYEAQSIALVIEKIKPHRPLTHDLMHETFKQFNIELIEVMIDKLVEGVFYAKLVCMQDGERREIDSRTSDAIAMALRAQCPIYTFKNIMDDAGIVLDTTDADEPQRQNEPKPKSKESDLSAMSTTDLEKELDRAIQVEDYDRAALIRDEINSREG